MDQFNSLVIHVPTDELSSVGDITAQQFPAMIDSALHFDAGLLGWGDPLSRKHVINGSPFNAGGSVAKALLHTSPHLERVSGDYRGGPPYNVIYIVDEPAFRAEAASHNVTILEEM